ncbi:hypothetical protein vseg_015892 [Gypsophila vaccaria]
MIMYQQQEEERQSPKQLPGSCFQCGKPGHWANTCPDNPRNNRTPVPKPATSSDDDNHFPKTQCRCGAGLCVIRVSNSINNPGCPYYTCPADKEMNCQYFKFCRDMKVEEIRDVQPERYPICGCGAGVCVVLVENSRVYGRRSYFACRVPKGEGACNHKQWLDDSPESVWVTSDNPVSYQTNLMTSDNPVSYQTNLMDDFKLSGEDEMQLDAAEMSASQIHMLKDQTQIKGEEAMSGEAPGLAVETHTVHPHPYFVENNVSEFMDPKMTICSSESLTNQICTSPVNSMQGCVNADVAALNNGSQEGSLPNFNLLPENLSHSDAQPRGRLLSNMQSRLKNGLHEGDIMSSSISATFEKLALHLQNDLIALLESMSPENHKSMSKEADSTFAALNSLQVDYKPFHCRVNEYIKQAACLAHIEQIINEDKSSQELVNHRNNEQRRFEELSKSYREARAAFMASNSQLSMLCEKTLSLDSSAELAMEISSCEMDNTCRRETLLQITKAMAECKERLNAVHQKAEAALMKSKEAEIKLNAAQLAFQTAKAQLRN